MLTLQEITGDRAMPVEICPNISAPFLRENMDIMESMEFILFGLNNV